MNNALGNTAKVVGLTLLTALGQELVTPEVQAQSLLPSYRTVSTDIIYSKRKKRSEAPTQYGEAWSFGNTQFDGVAIRVMRPINEGLIWYKDKGAKKLHCSFGGGVEFANQTNKLILDDNKPTKKLNGFAFGLADVEYTQLLYKRLGIRAKGELSLGLAAYPVSGQLNEDQNDVRLGNIYGATRFEAGFFVPIGKYEADKKKFAIGLNFFAGTAEDLVIKQPSNQINGISQGGVNNIDKGKFSNYGVGVSVSWRPNMTWGSRPQFKL
jgi:hypothetical protein